MRNGRLPSVLGWISPAWVKAPIVLMRFPALFVAIASAALVVAIAGASSPLVLSSVGNAALNRELSSFSKQAAGLTVTTFGRVVEDTFVRTHRALSESASSVDEFGPSSVTILTPSTTISRKERQADARVRLLARTNALSHINILSQVEGRGAFLARSTAAELGVRAGETIELRRGDQAADIRIVGIYEDLASAPISEYWRPMTFQIVNPIANQPPLDPFLIASRRTLFDIKKSVPGERPGPQIPGEQATFRWEFPLVPSVLTVPKARALTSEIHRIRNEANDPLSELGAAGTDLSAFGGPKVESLLPEIVGLSEDTVASLEGSARLISLAGVLVGLVVIGAAGTFSFTKRTVEVRLLSAQGVHPFAQGAKASLEGLLPIGLAAVAGWAIALWLTRELGPTPLISAGVPTQALEDVAIVALTAAGLLGMVFGVAVRRDAQIGSSRPRQIFARLPWEAVVLSLAAASFYEIATRGGGVVETPDGPPRVDVFLLAFPVLFMVGFAGLAARGLARLLPRLRTRGKESSAPVYLASRRLAASSRGVVVLIAASAIALGVLVYSGTVVATTDATADAKAMVLAGSETAATVSSDEDLPDDIGYPATLVSKTSVDVFPGDVPAEVLAIDPSTFADAAFWDDSFADRPLDELLEELSADDASRLPAVIAGSDAQVTTIERGSDQLPVRSIANALVWPGMAPNRPLMVVDRDSMEKALAAVGSTLSDALTTDELWVRGEPGRVLDALSAAGVVVEDVRTADEIRKMPALVSLSWTFSFLQALGVMAGAVALIGIVLYLQARQQAREISYALARKMGVSSGAHRSAVILELGAMLVIAFGLGATLALVAARLISSRLDPLPELPPAPLFGLPGMILWVTPVALLVGAVVGAWRVQRAADRMNVAEVMRLAG